MEQVDVIVAGAGVVGLAIAKRLSEAGRDVLVLEQHDAVGTETSSRNSEVIHAGIYYRPGGLRAALCVKGKEHLYRYCMDRSVPHERSGKLIVAFGDEECGRLKALNGVATQNGVHDLRLIDGLEAKSLEPLIACDAALLSPSSGIIDSHALMLNFHGDIENAGGAVVLSTPVIGGKAEHDGLIIETGGAAPMRLKARTFINAGGLYADRLARSVAGLADASIPDIRPAKGQYFIYGGKAPFSRLVYPLHTKDSQGIHYSNDLGGQARLGPDIQWGVEFGDYSVDEDQRAVFAADVRRFWPSLEADRLTPGYAGHRPKTAGPGEEGDFQILGPRDHGIEGYVGLYGIESPGLTACMAIADYVAEKLTP